MPEDPEPLRDVVSFGREHVGILAALGPNSASSATVVELDADVVDLVCGVARRMNRSVLALRRAWARCDPHLLRPRVPTGDFMTWNNDFWTRLGGEQPSLRLDMYYRRRDDLRLPVELVAGEPRVPVDAHVLALLDRVDQDVLFERVKDDRQRKNWTTNAAAVRAAAGKTVSLYSAVVATLVPIGATKRQTINLNVYAGLSFKVDALREMVDPDVREALAPLKKPFASAYDIAPLLGIATPHSTQDESATETEEPAEEPPGTEPTAATVAWDQHYNLIFFGPPVPGRASSFSRSSHRICAQPTTVSTVSRSTPNTRTSTSSALTNRASAG